MGGARQFLVGGVICLVIPLTTEPNSVYYDSCLITLRGTLRVYREEV